MKPYARPPPQYEIPHSSFLESSLRRLAFPPLAPFNQLRLAGLIIRPLALRAICLARQVSQEPHIVVPHWILLRVESSDEKGHCVLVGELQFDQRRCHLVSS